MDNEKEKACEELISITKQLNESDINKIKNIAIGIDLVRKDDASKNKDTA